MRKKLKIVPKSVRDWFGVFRALEWAWKKLFGKSIDFLRGNKTEKNTLRLCL